MEDEKPREGQSPSLELEQQVISGNKAFFPIHPDMLSDPSYLEIVGLSSFQRSNEMFVVTPTSSTRTVWTMGRNPNFMVKTDLDKRHYRFHRRLKRTSVIHSIQVSEQFELMSDDLSQYGIAYLPESIGLTMGHEDSRSVGVIFRETLPRPFNTTQAVLMPLFSLYGFDEYNPNDPLLLKQLIEANAGAGNEMIWFVDQIIGRIIRAWAGLVIGQGLLHEMHGQNCLLEVLPDMSIGRLVIRDLQGTYIDEQIRTRLGKSIFSTKHIVGREKGTTRESQFSHAYDHMVGEYLLDRLTDKLLFIYRHIDRQDVIERARALFREEFPNYKIHFPECTYGFGPQGENNEVQLVPKAGQATWR